MTRHTLSFRIHVPPIYKCSTSRILVTQTSLLHMLTAQVYMHVLFYLLVLWITVYITCIVVPCSRIHIVWLLPVTDMDIPVTGHESCWYAICGKPTSIVPVPGILFMLSCACYIVPDSRYIVLCYQQSSGPDIMFIVSCTVVVLVTLYTGYSRS